MLRLVVLAVLLLSAGWFAREASWIAIPFSLPADASSPHARYQTLLKHSGLSEVAIGRNWISASRNSLLGARRLTMPSRETLTFTADKPSAWGFRVTLERGQRVDIVATTASAVPAQVFVDVFEPDYSSSDLDHEDGGLRAATYEATADREIVVRVQPELGMSGQVTLAVQARPALRFPVADARARDLKSVFGDSRDAGRRLHEGVDIFAARGTPVLSASDGVVLRVGDNRLGGRVVWVWDPTRNLRLYYAHLNEQLVATGQLVRAGDVIGTVGNTGNAKTTPPHLHFGIYVRGQGAIDPFWFIAPAEFQSSRASR
jgi:murein DD-endopeptidase MepM/ murein hydrolase activator NlpD